MPCPSCREPTPADARFCAHCGARLAAVCSACRATLPAGARFCSACGTAASSEAASPAERRQVTVVFCDLVESTALSERLDPELLRDLMRGYHETCAREISRVGGYIAQYLGDGVLAYFGYPTAREQDAQAAVRAGLAISEAMRRGSVIGPDAPVAVRIGIHSGLVVAGEMGTGETRGRLAVGSTPNVAARMQALARPNAVLISETTHRLVEGFFACVDLGVQNLKGVDTPIHLYEVQGETAAQSRLEAGLGMGLTPLVAREREVALLVERFHQSARGEGQVVLVAGEAGFGKSRLLQELKSRSDAASHLRLECRCSPHSESSALFPIIDLLRRLWQLRRAGSAEELIARIEAGVARYAPAARDAALLLADLLSVPLPAHIPPLELMPPVRKQRTLDTLVAILGGMAEERPVLLVVEDLHWIDPSTLELLQLVVPRVAASRILLLLLFRPGFASPWSPGGNLTRIELDRLTNAETETMITSVAGGRALPADVVRDLCEKVDGVPLYAEELTKMVLESGALQERDGRFEQVRTLAALSVPMTLRESLMARLDRLAPVRDIVQLGATIGRAFSYGLIRAVSGLHESTLRAELARLVEAGVLYPGGTPGEPGYVFKHALIQDAAYESLLMGRRADYHLRIAETLERHFPEVVESQPERLGRHWAAAGRADHAIVHYLRAGRRAFDRSADAEATSQLERGLALLDGIEDAAARERYELELRIALGPVLVGTRGYSNPEVEAVYARARELVERAGGDARQRFTVLSGLLLFHQSRAEIATCLELTEQRLALAQELGDATLEMQVHENFGTLALWRGDFSGALTALRQAISRYTPEGGRALRLVYGTDSLVVSTTYEAQALYFLGYLDQAIAKAAESVAIARELGHVHSLVLALSFDAALHLQRGEPARARVLAEEMLALATEQQLAMWIGSAHVSLGDVLVLEGRPEEGIAEFLEGITGHRGTGATIAGRYLAARLGLAHLCAGKPSEGLAVLDAMMKALERCEDVFSDSEVHRVRGLLLLADAPGERAAAEACFQEALALARGFGSPTLELRAATSLARHWLAAGKRAAARELLAPVHAGFREGFDTQDLREAANLLEKLGASA